jgi:alpha-1,3-rhamnosyl/mannosyltransferase
LYHYPFLDLPYVNFPSVVTIYDLNPILHPEYFDRFARIKRALAFRLIRSTLRRSRAALAISDATRKLVQERYPESMHKVRTIHLGVDPDAWTGDAKGDEGDAKGSINQHASWRTRSYVLYVGVDRPHKNLVRLVRAFGRFRKRNRWQDGSGPYLWLAGVGAGSRELRLQLSELALGKDVRLDPALDEAGLRAAYLGSSALAYVSTSEGFGLPILEAFAAGVPVVAADASSLPEVAGEAALYTNPEDEQAISNTLDRIWNDGVLRRTLAERGRRRIKEFSWNATASATLRAYYDVLECRPTPQPGTHAPQRPLS